MLNLLIIAAIAFGTIDNLQTSKAVVLYSDSYYVKFGNRYTKKWISKVETFDGKKMTVDNKLTKGDTLTVRYEKSKILWLTVYDVKEVFSEVDSIR